MIKIISILALLAFASCSKPHYGCTKREQRQSAKHFNKSFNWCANEAMRQSLVHFPMKESDSTWSEVQTVTDTITKYDTTIINDTVYITKYVDKIVNKVTTNTKEVRVEDGRKIGMLQNDINILEKKLAKSIEDKIKAEKGKAKSDGKLVVFYWAFGVVAGIVCIRFAVKNFKPKIPFFGALIVLFLPSCVTINVCEKPKLACVISDKHDCGKVIYADTPSFKPTHKYCSYGTHVLAIGGLTDEQYFERFPHRCKLDTPYRNQEEPLTFPVWKIKNCDTTFKN